MTAKDFVEGLCRKAIAQGADPVEVEMTKQAALDACGGSMARLAQHMKILQAIDEFEAQVRRMQQRMVLPLGRPFRRILTEEDRQDLLHGLVQAYPEEIEQLLGEIHPPGQ